MICCKNQISSFHDVAVFLSDMTFKEIAWVILCAVYNVAKL